MRAALRVVLGLVLLGVLSGCSAGRRAGPTTAAPAPLATGAPEPGPTPAGPLPAVVAELSFSLPGGDAYQPQAVALDEHGQAVILCYGYGDTPSSSALALVDLAQGTRGRLVPLPGYSFGPLAVGAGRAYVGYEDGAYHQRLAAVDLASGQVAADVATDMLFSSDTLVATPAGRLYLPLTDGLEVRDGATLQVLETLPFAATPDRTLAADLAHDRLYLAVGESLRAYRASDLAPKWEVAGLAGRTRLVVDQAGARIYAQCEAYHGGDLVVQLLAFDAGDGSALGPVSVPGEPGWQLVAADSAAGRLVFARSSNTGVRLWQTGFDGRPTGAEAALPGWATGYAAGEGRLLALLPGEHLLQAFDLANLTLTHEVPLGVELRHVLADAAHERVYVNDSAGRVHAVDTRTYQVLATAPAGRGELALDAANGLLFAGREAHGREVSVLRSEPLAATAVITGGYRVAVDSPGRRAFVGWTALHDPTPGEVQVWDTRTFTRLGAIAHRGEPAYNPLRDEVYLQDYSAYVADGKTLAVTGELTPDIGQMRPGLEGCNGCLGVKSIAVDPALDAVVVSLQTYATGGGPGTIPQPRLFSARTLAAAPHTVTVLPRARGDPRPFILPPDGGRVYEGQVYQRYVAYAATLAYPAGAADPVEARDGLPLTLYLPGSGVGLSAQQGQMLAFDTSNWQPLGWLPRYDIGEIDLAGRRLYAWAGARLTVLAFAGAVDPTPAPPTPWAPGGVPVVQAIVLSPAFARDRTAFMVAGGQVLRSSDGGEHWLRLRGGLPPGAPGAIASYSLALSPAYGQDHTLFAGGRLGEAPGLGVWHSGDGGETWAPAWQGLEHLRVERVVISPRYAEDQTLLAYCQYSEFWRADSGTSLFRSTDGGRSWARLASHSSMGESPPLPAPEALLSYPAEPVQFRIAARGDAVERCTDGGRSWVEVLRRADPAQRPLAVERSPRYEEDRQVFALFEDRLYRSTDGGERWQTAAGPELVRTEYPQYFSALAVGEDVGDGVTLLLGDQSGAVRVLDPAALHWAPSTPPTPTAAPSPPASPTPYVPPAAPLAAAYAGWAARLGWPLDAGAEVQMAIQPFERGLMLWRGDTREVYVLAAQAGANGWASYPDTWQEGQPESDPALAPPAGREQPVRGFGKVWREQLGGLGATIGWALEGERGYSGTWQAFAGGRLATGPDGRVYALFAAGNWE